MAKTKREKVLDKLVNDIEKNFPQNDQLEAAHKLNALYNDTRITTRNGKTIEVKKYTAGTLEAAFKKAYPKYYEKKVQTSVDMLIAKLEGNNPEE